MAVYGPVTDNAPVCVDIVHELVPGKDVAFSFTENFEELEFHSGEIQLDPVQGGNIFLGIKCE